MTEGLRVRNSAGMAKGLSGWQPTFFLLVVIPAKAGIQEGGPGCQVDNAGDACRDNPWLSFPLRGHGLSKPLDSSLRRAAPGFLPSRRIQDFLSINDGEAGVRNSAGMAKGLSGWLPACSLLVVIPAKARLQGCTPAWMQVVERRLEQAAEVVERRREQAAEVFPIPLLWRGARQGGVVE